MANYGIQGDLLEVTVVSCNKLKDTEWISRQDPYVHIEYGSNKSSTRTCKDGGKNPTFQEKFVYSLIEGLRELTVTVWNSNTITHDDFIGSGRIPLSKALSQGFDDSSWPLQSKTGRHAGEVRLIMHYSNANANKPAKENSQKPSKGIAPSGPPYGHQTAPPANMYSAPPPSMYGAPPPSMYAAPPPAASYPPQGGAYPPPPSAYPSYPPTSGVYPPAPYPPQATPNYPPTPYPHGSHYPPGSSYPGMYPPPPY